MKNEKYFAYDILDIPDEIKKMTKAERLAEIERLENEAALKREQKDNPISQAV